MAERRKRVPDELGVELWSENVEDIGDPALDATHVPEGDMAIRKADRDAPDLRLVHMRGYIPSCRI